MPAKGGEEATMTGFPKALARIVKAGNLPEDITAHVLRHSFASLAADLGYSDSTIGELIGHRNGAGITRRYIHRSDAVLLAAADA
ncbi:MAG: tyrosine-type recombinase/integrase, partial [Acetobacteraceae bacterium]|nr:tyrosine-type recombinase/integrase [Acetobacteraceae bacterium]